MRPRKDAPDAQAIQAWLVAGIAKELRIKAEAIDVHAPLSRYELDSVEAAAITAKLEGRLHRRLEPTMLWQSMTIAELSERLAKGHEGNMV